MTVGSEEDICKLKAIGRIVAITLQQMVAHTKAGITTREIDELGSDLLRQHGARSAPRLMYQFPGATCISVNEEAAHGIPGDKLIRQGDVVNIDVSAEKAGYFADSGFTFIVPPDEQGNTYLLETAKLALIEATAVAVAGNRLNQIGKAIELRARKNGFKTLRDLASHGIGRSLHEYPESIPNYFDKKDKRILKDGMVITIEPFISTRAECTEASKDGWTLSCPENNRSAQFEHTMIITKTQPIITTAW